MKAAKAEDPASVVDQSECVIKICVIQTQACKSSPASLLNAITSAN